MKELTTIFSLRALGLLLAGVTVVSLEQKAPAQELLDASSMQLVQKEAVPKFGTFWLAFGPGG